jgi:hypothetical protein
MVAIRKRDYSKHSTTRLKLILKHRLDKGEKGQDKTTYTRIK